MAGLLAPECAATLVPSADTNGLGVAMVTAVAQRVLIQRHEVEQLLAPLRLSRADLERVQGLMRQEMERGLGRDSNADASVRMLPTYVCNTPDGTGEGQGAGKLSPLKGRGGSLAPLTPPPGVLPAERGDFLALDLGGTNFRVLVVRVMQEGIHMASEIYVVPTSIMQGTGEAVRLRHRARAGNCPGAACAWGQPPLCRCSLTAAPLHSSSTTSSSASWTSRPSRT